MGNDHRWYSRPILSQDHIEGLEHAAAIHEFEHGLPRSIAEEKAYHQYKMEHHRSGAAHHLVGLKAAQAAGDMDEAQKHGVAYGMHMEAMGADPTDPVPPEVEKLAQESSPKVYRFKSHKSDGFLVRR